MAHSEKIDIFMSYLIKIYWNLFLYFFPHKQKLSKHQVSWDLQSIDQETWRENNQLWINIDIEALYSLIFAVVAIFWGGGPPDDNQDLHLTLYSDITPGDVGVVVEVPGMELRSVVCKTSTFLAVLSFWTHFCLLVSLPIPRFIFTLDSCFTMIK